MTNTGPSLALSRRGLLVLGAAPLGRLQDACPDFDLWWAEHQRIAELINATPEADEAACDQLFDRCFELERRIMDTRSSSACAVRAKSSLLLRLMEMERHDDVSAMRDVHAFVCRVI